MTQPPLRIFSDLGLIPEGEGHCLMLIPFLGGYPEHDGYARLEEEGGKILQLVAAEDAEMALLPFDGGHLLDPGRPVHRQATELAARFVERARAAGLRTIVLVNSDSDAKVPLPDVLVFRNSLNRRTRAPHEFALPAWHEDLLAGHFGGQLRVRDKSDVPSVGFCGHVAESGPPIGRRAKMAMRRLAEPFGIRIDHNDGIYLRRDAIEALSRCPAVETRFIRRAKYFGGSLADGEAKARVRREYIENLTDSDYTLCVRGYGNFSFRFFEALSIGRTPLLIDTECVLPYDFLHDYRDYCVIVPERRRGKVGRAVAEFHARLSPEGYHDLQRKTRAFWEEWLSPMGFFGNLPRHWRDVPGGA